MDTRDNTPAPLDDDDDASLSDEEWDAKQLELLRQAVEEAKRPDTVWLTHEEVVARTEEHMRQALQKLIRNG